MAVPRKSIPVVEEQLEVGKKIVDTGRGVRVTREVTTREEPVDAAGWREELDVERVPRDEAVDPGWMPGPRTEGDTLVIPVFEEVLVVKRELRLKEEVRITRRRVPVPAHENVVLRREEVTVTRFDEGPNGPDPSGTGH